MKAAISLAEARRIALSAQGFAGPHPPSGVTLRHLRRLLARLGVLQLDSINVVVRSHYMPVFSRLGAYPLALLDDLYRRPDLFEYWGHEASLMPIGHYPMLRHRMEAARPERRVAALIEDQPGYISSVLQEVRQRGPLTVAELQDPGRRTGPWWGESKGKIALEWLFASGQLAARERRNFARVYDISERVVPAHVMASPPMPAGDAWRAMLRVAARAHGIGTARDLADYYRLPTQDARVALEELAEGNELYKVKVEGWREAAYLHPGAKLPRKIEARALLSPFDSLVWYRHRTERLFTFRYRIEVYVPEPDRHYGYYVMPFLLGDELVARMDLKAQRAESTLLVQGAYVEESRDPSPIAAELGTELKAMAEWLGLERVRVGDRGSMAKALQKTLPGS